MKQYHSSFVDRFSSGVARYTGSSWAFGVALSLVVIRALTGPLFDYSTSRQLIINTGTTIITFLMVFLIQKAQNKDSIAMQIKLNELIAANGNASNRLIDVEDLTEDELNVIREFYVKLSELSKKSGRLHHIFSIDAAHANHTKKSHAIGAETLELLDTLKD